ncbi:hypothetical protein, conserved [Plasmodium gonderi]|uniref:Uncharacterized protein n=1 Tax=Plasmodium gonderi TaxID=77519 RepID=A0A1Y1JAT9_PLAGO|nr:hypothetical protein, conserved [Plasmodium gonderi]GAW79370.1 hypothetical protein, conserved [Plasmodium gonderi]
MKTTKVEHRVLCDRKLLKFENICRGNNHSIIHSCLWNNDVVAALDHVRKGTSPFVRDECNRTAVDLAITLFMKKFHESLFTSLITDYMYTNRFVSKRSCLSYNEKNRIAIQGVSKISHSEYPPIRINQVNETNRTDVANRVTETDQLDILTPFLITKGIRKKKNTYFSSLETSPCHELDCTLGKWTQDAISQSEKVVTICVTKPVQAQLDEILKILKALLFFIKTLSKNIRLRKYSESTVKEQISKLSFPYLYNTTMHTLFKIFSYDHGQIKKWNIKNPADSRILVRKILSKNLVGNEIIKFMGKCLFCFSKLVHIFGEKVYQLESITSQYLLHMSFTFDNEYLFNVIVNKDNIFQQTEIFHWDKLIDSISPYKHSFRFYYQPLIHARLKKFFIERMESVLRENVT